MGFFRPADKPLLNLGLFVTTLLTTFGSYLYSHFDGELSGTSVRESLVFSGSLLGILGAHELGHYALARRHGVDASLPWFIPSPIGLGTFGAVIRIRGPIPTRNALLDIGAAGPLAGLLVGIPLFVYGLFHSSVADGPLPPDAFPAPGSLYSLLRDLVLQVDSSAAAGDRAQLLFGDSLLMRWLQSWVLGPFPDGKDLIIHPHPTVTAAWFGFLVTMLNLIPIGQLDGGHVAHAVLGAPARRVGQVMGVGMVFLCCFYSAGWLLWLIITTQFVGFAHPEVLAPQEPVTLGRKAIAALCLVAFVLCVMPVPISIVPVPP